MRPDLVSLLAAASANPTKRVPCHRVKNIDMQLLYRPKGFAILLSGVVEVHFLVLELC